MHRVLLIFLLLAAPSAHAGSGAEVVQYYRSLTAMVLRVLHDGTPHYRDACDLSFFAGDGRVSFQWWPLENGATIEVSDHEWEFGEQGFRTRVRVLIDGYDIAAVPGAASDGIVEATARDDNVHLPARYPVLTTLRGASKIQVVFPDWPPAQREFDIRARADVIAAVDRCWSDTGYIEHDWLP